MGFCRHCWCGVQTTLSPPPTKQHEWHFGQPSHNTINVLLGVRQRMTTKAVLLICCRPVSVLRDSRIEGVTGTSFQAVPRMTKYVSGVVVEVATDGSGLTADNVQLSDDAIRRSQLLLHIRNSCTGSACLPLNHDQFVLWCGYTPGELSWSDLVTVMKVSSPPSEHDVDSPACCGQMSALCFDALVWLAGVVVPPRLGFTCRGLSRVRR